jgi:hypothetical protein
MIGSNWLTLEVAKQFIRNLLTQNTFLHDGIDLQNVYSQMAIMVIKYLNQIKT